MGIKKSHKKTKYIETYNSTWKWEFNFFIGWDWQKFRKAMVYWEAERPKASPPLGYCLNVWADRRSYIWVTDRKNYPTLAHECIHGATACLNQSGVNIDCENDEPLTFLVTWMMKEALGEKHRND